MTVQNVIPVIDLFAGPGGLCEGFSSVKDAEGNPRFAVKVSIEKDPVAHRTLHLRALFRKFPKGEVPEIYYQYIRGEVKRQEFLAHPDIKEAAEEADQEARCAELGLTPPEVVDGWISAALGQQKNWVLIGGPPCQAYSLAGRSRLRGKSAEFGKRIRAAGMATLLVTHDQTEAASMADRCVRLTSEQGMEDKKL